VVEVEICGLNAVKSTISLQSSISMALLKNNFNSIKNVLAKYRQLLAFGHKHVHMT